MEKNKLMMVVIIALLLVLLGTIIGGFVFVLKTTGDKTGDKETRREASTVVDIPLDKIESRVINGGEPFTTNLAPGADGASHVVSVSISLGVDNRQPKKAKPILAIIEEKEPIIRAAITKVLKGLTYEELKQPNGGEILEGAILERMQELFDSNLIIDVYSEQLYVP